MAQGPGRGQRSLVRLRASDSARRPADNRKYLPGYSVTFRFKPDEEPEGELDRLSDLVGHPVPNKSYEAWTLSGPRGMLAVCMPGGELAIWDEKKDD